MNFKIKLLGSFLFMFLFLFSVAAQDTIRLTNPSFEGLPGNSITPKGWRDCGFDGETPPDVQPGGGFKVWTPPFDGVTYLGMVCRDNRTNEQVCQKLDAELVAGQCYRFSLKICQSPIYYSMSRSTNLPLDFTEPISAEVWLGDRSCRKSFWVGTTVPVGNQYWQEYIFEFKPDKNYKFLSIVAGSEEDVSLRLNGNILVDDASDIIPIDCKSK